jgi:hypothetical protein
LLRFFFAVGKRNEVPPRTVANSGKQEPPTHNSREQKQNRPKMLTSEETSNPKAPAEIEIAKKPVHH